MCFVEEIASKSHGTLAGKNTVLLLALIMGPQQSSLKIEKCLLWDSDPSLSSPSRTYALPVLSHMYTYEVVSNTSLDCYKW